MKMNEQEAKEKKRNDEKKQNLLENTVIFHFNKVINDMEATHDSIGIYD
jgi:hypothetical protein